MSTEYTPVRCPYCGLPARPAKPLAESEDPAKDDSAIRKRAQQEKVKLWKCDACNKEFTISVT